MTILTEAELEQAALDWLVGLGWQVVHGPTIAPDTPRAERANYGEVILERRLRRALERLNSNLPVEALAAEGKDRVFILAAPGESGHDFIAEEDGEQGEELVIHFEYRPATLTDWPEEERDGKRVLSSFVFLDTTGSNGGAGFLQRPQQIRRRRQNPRVSQSDARIALRGVGDLRLDGSKLLRISGTASSARTRTFSPTSH